MRSHISATSVTKLSHIKVKTKDLAVHLWLHSGEKPYQNNQSRMSLSDNSYIIRHIRAHIGEKSVSITTLKNHYKLVRNHISATSVTRLSHKKVILTLYPMDIFLAVGAE